MGEFDAVVTGGGPNGLAAALRLAEAGWSVCLVEANQDVGGSARTIECTLPSFRQGTGEDADRGAAEWTNLSAKAIRQVPNRATGRVQQRPARQALAALHQAIAEDELLVQGGLVGLHDQQVGGVLDADQPVGVGVLGVERVLCRGGCYAEVAGGGVAVGGERAAGVGIITGLGPGLVSLLPSNRRRGGAAHAGSVTDSGVRTVGAVRGGLSR